MTPPLNASELEQFSEALVSEVKAEMGRRGWSSRALGREIGQSSQYMSFRLDGGNPRTGERVALTVQDIAAIASAFDWEPFELLERAQESMRSAMRINTRRRTRVEGSPVLSEREE